MAKAPAKAPAKRTRTRTTAARKTSASLSAEVKEETAVTAPTLETQTDAADDAPEALRKKDLIEAAVERAGVKKRDAKPAIEAALAILGETLAEGRGLNMPGLGKIKVQNSKDLEGVKVVNLRLRRKVDGAETDDSETGEEGLAASGE